MTSPLQRRPASAVVSRPLQRCQSLPCDPKRRPKSSHLMQRAGSGRLALVRENFPLPTTEAPSRVRFYIDEEDSDSCSEFDCFSQSCSLDISAMSDDSPSRQFSTDSTKTSSNTADSDDDEGISTRFSSHDFYHPCEFDLLSEFGHYNFDSEGCHFGKIPTRFSVKRLYFDLLEPCKCSPVCSEDGFGRWASPCEQKLQPKQKAKQRKGAIPGQVPRFYQRLNGMNYKDACYKFHHYSDTSQYIEQYRENNTVVAKELSLRKPEVEERYTEPQTPIPVPDPYGLKLKQQAYSAPLPAPVRQSPGAIADNCGFFAVFSVDKDSDTPECHSSLSTEFDEDLRTLSMKERGRNVNLAPVREVTTERDLKPDEIDHKGVVSGYHDTRLVRHERPQPKIFQKPCIAVNQYLNLVIPKTTLHRTNLQLDLDLPREHWAAKPETRRNTNAVRKRRNGSADSSKRAQSDTPRRAQSLSSNRASELRIARANTYVNGINIARETGLFIPPPPNITKYKMNGQKFKCAERIRETMMTELNGSRNMERCSPRNMKRWDLGDRIYNETLKYDKALPSPVKPMAIKGRSCRTDDQLTIMCRLRKEKERTERNVRLTVK